MNLIDEKEQKKDRNGTEQTSIVSCCIGLPNVNQDIGKWFASFDINDTYIQ